MASTRIDSDGKLIISPCESSNPTRGMAEDEIAIFKTKTGPLKATDSRGNVVEVEGALTDGGAPDSF